jgi:hypothetical protein
MVQKLGQKAAPKTEAAPVASNVEKKEKVAPVTIDLSNIAKSYKELESTCKEKSSTGVKSSDMLGVVKELFDETGQDELMLSAVSKIVAAKFGRKLYNQLRSAILSKTSGYDLDTKDNEQVFIVKGKKTTEAAE